MLFYHCYLCGFQLYPSFGGGIVEVYAILIKKWGFEACVCPNRGAFTCPCVGCKSIRPPNVPPKEGESPAIGRGQAFAIHGMALCGAYAIRPYPDSRKMIAVGACSIVLPQKQAAFWGCYEVGYEKRGAMPAFYCLAWRRSYACDLFYLGRVGVNALVALIV